jgi:hypothetical protein
MSDGDYIEVGVRRLTEYVVGKDRETRRLRNFILTDLKRLEREGILERLSPVSNKAWMVSRVRIYGLKLKEYIEKSEGVNKEDSKYESVDKIVWDIWIKAMSVEGSHPIYSRTKEYMLENEKNERDFRYYDKKRINCENDISEYEKFYVYEKEDVNSEKYKEYIKRKREYKKVLKKRERCKNRMEKVQKRINKARGYIGGADALIESFKAWVLRCGSSKSDGAGIGNVGEVCEHHPPPSSS